MSVTAAKVSAMVATGVICFALGAGAGGMGMMYFGQSLMGGPDPAGTPGLRPNGPGGGMGGGGMGGGGMGGGGMAGGRGQGGGNPFGGRGAIYKRDLTALVTKLDQLTKKPLAVTLNDEQAKKISEQLAGLDEKAELTDEEAKKRVDAIWEIVEKQKETMEAAGYRRAGQAAGGPGAGGPGAGGGGRGNRGGGAQQDANTNPFTEEQNKAHLKSLQERLGKTGASAKPA